MNYVCLTLVPKFVGSNPALSRRPSFSILRNFVSYQLLCRKKRRNQCLKFILLATSDQNSLMMKKCWSNIFQNKINQNHISFMHWTKFWHELFYKDDMVPDEKRPYLVHVNRSIYMRTNRSLSFSFQSNFKLKVNVSSKDWLIKIYFLVTHAGYYKKIKNRTAYDQKPFSRCSVLW